MNKWLQRWNGLAPREQWMGVGIAAVLLVVCYLLLVADPLALRIEAAQKQQGEVETRAQEARNSIQELKVRLDNDPNKPMRLALDAAGLRRGELEQRIEAQTSILLSPQRMKELLQELLRNQPGLSLVELQTSSEPLRLAGDAAPADPAAQPGSQPAPLVLLHKHSLVLRLEGGYFDLLTYLVALQGSEFRVYWDSLEYEVGEAGHKRASITLQLHTLSRSARFLGV